MLGVIRIFAHEACGFVGSELLLAMVRKEVVFHIYKLAFFIDPGGQDEYEAHSCWEPVVFCLPFECVAAVSMLVSPALWSAVVAEEHHTVMIATAC